MIRSMDVVLAAARVEGAEITYHDARTGRKMRIEIEQFSATA